MNNSITKRPKPRLNLHTKYAFTRFVLFLTLIATFFISEMQAQGSGTNIVVTTLADNGPGSLREAVGQAIPSSVITFHPSLSGGTIVLTSGEIFIEKVMTIQGPGPEHLAISGNGISRIFRISHLINTTENGRALIKGFTLKNGNPINEIEDPRAGGAILNHGALLIENCVLSDHQWAADGSASISAGSGGVIFNLGNLQIRKSHFINNQVWHASLKAQGGGIFNWGVLEIEESIFENNRAGTNGEGGAIYHAGGTITIKTSSLINNYADGGVRTLGDGGGLYVNAGTATVEACTFSENTAGYGGAIYRHSGQLAILNSTISNNKGFWGGGINNSNGEGSLSLNYSTIAFNQSTQMTNSSPLGGGIYNSGALTMTNSIIAENLNIGRLGPNSPIITDFGDINGEGTSIHSEGYNLLGVNLIQIAANTGDIFGHLQVPKEARLGPLADNGGLTKTHALLPNSPALDAANPNGFPSIDQRGYARPFGDRPDIGAFEAVGDCIVTNTNDDGLGSLRYVVGLAPAGCVITFDQSLANTTIELISGQISINKPLTIQGLGAHQLTVSGGNKSRIFNISEGINGVVTIQGLTLKDGDAIIQGHRNKDGGAIYNASELLIKDCVLERNYAEKGGAIHINGDNSRLEMDSCIIKINRSSEGGGGIYFSGANMEMANCVVDDNSVNSYGFSNGGGLYLHKGQILIRQSTISHNYGFDFISIAYGGGIYNESSNLSIQNTTISGNVVNGRGITQGGGIYNNTDGTIRLLHTTITRNACSAQGPYGGGIYNLGQLDMGHSIIQGNHVANPENGVDGYNSGGTITSNGYNIIGNNTGFNFSEEQTDVLNYEGSLLGPLEDNGGFTQTHALIGCAGPAIDKGNPSGTLSVDQRGFPRPVNSIPDIGAYEGSGEATTYVVTSNADDGSGSLREIIANACPGSAITFDPSLTNDFIKLTSGEIMIDKALTIQGLGVGSLAISTRASRIFRITANATDVVKVLDLSLREGNAQINDATEYKGGAIYNYGNLVLERVKLSQNQIVGPFGEGGAIYNEGELTLIESEVSDNSVSGNTTSGGGGIYNQGGNIKIIHSAIINNKVERMQAHIKLLGGGLVNNGGNVVIQSSTFAQNETGSDGGAIFNNGTIEIYNATISANKSYSGGGIYNSGDARVDHSTIVYNAVDPRERGIPNGGGIYNSGTFSVSNSIIAGNTRDPMNSNILPNDVAGTNIISGGYNLIGVNEAIFIASTGDMTGDISSPLDPQLGELGDQGGKTYTHALLACSPAINAADPADTSSIDQRVYPRPYGDHTDIGAYEYGASISNETVVTSTASDGPGSLKQIVQSAPPGSEITFSLPPNAVISLEAHLSIDKDLRIIGPEEGFPIIEGGDDRVFKILSCVEVHMENLNITGGYLETQFFHSKTYRGGGVYNQGELSLKHVNIYKNYLLGSTSLGAGIFNDSLAVLTMDACYIYDNGAIGNIISHSGSGVGKGGGIYNSGELILKNSTISNNSASGGGSSGVAIGGGIFNEGILTVENATFSSNHLGGRDTRDGFAMYNATTGRSSLNHVTIGVNNGRGIDNKGIIDMQNTLIADGAHSRNLDGGTVNSLGYNLVEYNEGFISQPGPGDLLEIIEPLNLGDLELNDYSIPTHALLEGSPAINAANPNSTLDHDQRGNKRPLGGRADIGAYEFGTDCIVTNNHDSGLGSLRHTVALAPPGCLITFDPSLNHSTIALTSGEILIDKALTIQGISAQQLRISAGNNSRIFRIEGTENDTVLIEKLTLQDGNSSDEQFYPQHGGAMYNEGFLTVSKCIFTQNNGADSITGGAIFNAGNLKVEDCTFRENEIPEGVGAAIANNDSLLVINCDFEQNTAKNGGAIFNFGEEGMALLDSRFISNTAMKNGGALNHFSDGNMWMKACDFKQNQATNGGAISTNYSVIQEIPIVATRKFNISTTTFLNNQAHQNGGAIYALAGDYHRIPGSSPIFMDIDSCIINDNQAGSRGGGVFNLNSYIGIHATTIDGNFISVNGGISEGGGLYVKEGIYAILRSTISDNLVEDGLASASGGGIYNQASSLLIYFSTISGNTASGRGAGNGGGIYNDSEGQLALVHSTVTKNKSSAQNAFGGGIYNAGRWNMGHTILLGNHVDIFTNGAEGYNAGGRISSGGFNLIGSNAGLSFPTDENDILGFVGTILGPLQNNGGLTSTHALLNCSNPAIDGGASTNQEGIYPYDQRHIFMGDEIKDIGAFEFGGEPETNIVTSTADAGLGTLREMVASACEGAVITFAPDLANHSILLTSGEIVIDKALTIQGLGMNQLTISAEGNSRIFRMEQALEDTVKLYDLTLKKGNAANELHHTQKGNAIYNAGSLMIDSVAIVQNNSIGLIEGGGIYNAGNLWVNQSKISHNRLTSATSNTRGGGIYSTGSLFIDKSRFEKNWTGGPGSGGAIYQESGQLRIENTSVIDNFAGADPVHSAGSGGGLYVEEGSANILASTFSANSSDGIGGAIHNFRGNISILNSTISGNDSYYGGGIDNGPQATLTIDFSTIVRNFSAQKGRGTSDGGGIRNAGQLNVSNTIIAENMNHPARGGSHANDLAGTGTFNSLGYNLFGALTDAFSTATGDQWGTEAEPLDPQIQSLRDYGGFTYTHSLIWDGPTRDAANPNNTLTVDQRGKEVPFGVRRYIGAYEVIFSPDCDANIAYFGYGSTATASSVRNPAHAAQNVIDGNYSTRWESEWSDPQWITIDLGRLASICAVFLRWENAYGKAFNIDVSKDGENWETVESIENNTELINELTLESIAVGRYVRIFGTERGTQWGYSLYEVAVYADPEVVPNCAPIVQDFYWDIPAYSLLGTAVGTVEASDPNEDNLSFIIQSGNTDNAFAINSESGVITVNNSDALSSGSIFSLEVVATDDGFPSLSDTGSIVVEVVDEPACMRNLALNRPVFASSEENDDHGLLPATNAIDGNPNTRWSSEWSDPQWIYVDLGREYELCTVILNWEGAFGRDFRIEVSKNATDWQVVHTVTGNNSQHNTFENLNGTGRYVRMFGISRATQWGYSLFEFEVYGMHPSANRPPIIESSNFDINPYSPANTSVGQVIAYDPDGDPLTYELLDENDGSLTIDSNTGEIKVANGDLMTPARIFTRYVKVTDSGNLSAEAIQTFQVGLDCETNIALNRPAMASSEENDDHGLLPAVNAVDGNPNTRWSSEWSDPQWIYVDLGQSHHLCKVVLKWENAFARDFRIEESDNATNWNVIHTENGNNSQHNILDNISGTGRYVRMYGMSRATQYGYSLYEFEVYGTPVPNNVESPSTTSRARMHLNIFPNPAKDHITVSFESQITTKTQISLYSLQGQKLLDHEYQTTQGANEVKLQIGYLPDGSYLLRVSNHLLNEQKRFIIVK